MFKRTSILLIFLSAILMLQVHNIMPHLHDIDPVKVHGHSHDDHDHGKEQNSEPFSDSDHSVDFGQAIVKPGNSKNEIINLDLFIAANLFSTIRFGISLNTEPILRPPITEDIILPLSVSYGTPLRAPPQPA